MPQLNKGGKFIFGKSLIRDDLTIHLPTQVLTEYHTTIEGKVYLFTGSKVTGGFCVTRKGLLEPSKLGHILTDNHLYNIIKLKKANLSNIKDVLIVGSLFQKMAFFNSIKKC